MVWTHIEDGRPPTTEADFQEQTSWQEEKTWGNNCKLEMGRSHYSKDLQGIPEWQEIVKNRKEWRRITNLKATIHEPDSVMKGQPRSCPTSTGEQGE